MELNNSKKPIRVEMSVEIIGPKAKQITKKKRILWKFCHYIMRSSWVVLPVILCLKPWLSIPWALIHLVALFLVSEEYAMKVEKEGTVPTEWGV